MDEPELEAAVSLYRQVLRRRRQVSLFTGWVGTVERLAETLRMTEGELRLAEEVYLRLPDADSSQPHSE